MIKYRTNQFMIGIEKVKCDSETDRFILINGVRHKKRSDYEQYHDSFDLAKEYLKSKLQIIIDERIVYLDQTRKKFSKIHDLQESDLN